MMIRSFVAIELSDSIRHGLLGVVEQMRHRVPRDSVRWTNVSGIHLTLKFLGDVGEDDLPRIKDILSQVGQRHDHFTLAVGGVGCFPNAKRPRVVWVGVDEQTGHLTALQRDVEESLGALGFQPEERGFQPHLTLGRTRRDVSSRDQGRLGETVATAGVGTLGQMHVESFRLMRSDLRPDGAVYSTLALFRLGATQEPQ